MRFNNGGMFSFFTFGVSSESLTGVEGMEKMGR
jgi:hypothetical protein